MNDSTTEAIAQGYVDALLAHDEETAFAHFRETAAIVVSGRHMLAGSLPLPGTIAKPGSGSFGSMMRV